MLTSVYSSLTKLPGIKPVLDALYAHLPLGFRLGPEFRATYRLLGESQWWTAEKLQAYQWKKLMKVLRHAFEHVPYYRDTWDAAGVTPEKIQTPEEFQRIPFTTKRIFQDHLDALKATNFPASAFQYNTTGGSTGIPFGFYDERRGSHGHEWAFILRQWERVGYRPGVRCAVIRGSVIPSAERGMFWELDHQRNELLMSSYHLTDENMPAYLSKLETFAPEYIQAYPSAISILADYLRRTGQRPSFRLRAILTGSENLYPWQRTLIENAFGCRVFSWYGHAEKAVLAAECEHSTEYHLFPEYGYTELVDETGRVITNPNEPGEIVATGFNNPVMPFIRYRTMDVGVWAAGVCQCGRAYQRLQRIEGRLQELIVSGDGRKISMTAINMHNPVFDGVRQFQFIQEKPGFVTFVAVRKPGYTELDTQNIRRELQKKLGQHMQLEITFAEEIPRTSSGKYRFLLQRIPVPLSDH